jgi:glutathione synthase/RimK-type ligase-like ATP-grasp enzyme
MRIAPRRYSDSNELAEIERRLEGAPDDVDALFERACALEDLGWSEPAVQAYGAVLQRDYRHLGTLTNLGSMVLAHGDAEKARQFFTLALTHHPLALITHVNLGHALFAQGEITSAVSQYQAALAVDGGFFAAHHALALLHESSGDATRAEHHWERAFEKGASWTLPFTGSAPPLVRVLVVISGRGGDLVAHRYLDEQTMQTTMVLADGFRSGMPLAPHGVVFNAIGDADRCATSLERAKAVLAASAAPAINDPVGVLETGRAANAERFAALPGVMMPRTERIARSALTATHLLEHGWTFPLLVRSPGHQGGRHFELVNEPESLAAALARLPGDELFVIAFADTRKSDGFTRKYRVLFIDGVIYPVHLAVSSDWKVHYFSSDMSDRADHREEERQFLAGAGAALGAPAMTALAEIGRTLGLDYAGVDFGIDPAGNVIVFEANATMAVFPPPGGEQWAYRRPAYDAVVAAMRALIFDRAGVVR